MTTKREQELLKKIDILKIHLEKAKKQEIHPNQLFSHRKKTPFFEWVMTAIEKIRHIRLLRHKYTRGELWFKRLEAFFVGAAIILFWRGIWNLADHYLFPDHSNISAFASLFIGLGILMLSRNFVNQFIDDAVEEADEYE